MLFYNKKLHCGFWPEEPEPELPIKGRHANIYFSPTEAVSVN